MPGINERNVSALLRFARTMAKPNEADAYQVATIRAAIAAHNICPDCGGLVHIDDDVEIIMQAPDEREAERRPAVVAFCSGCEFSMEMPEVQR